MHLQAMQCGVRVFCGEQREASVDAMMLAYPAFVITLYDHVRARISLQPLHHVQPQPHAEGRVLPVRHVICAVSHEECRQVFRLCPLLSAILHKLHRSQSHFSAAPIQILQASHRQHMQATCLLYYYTMVQYHSFPHALTEQKDQF